MSWLLVLILLLLAIALGFAARLILAAHLRAGQAAHGELRSAAPHNDGREARSLENSRHPQAPGQAPLGVQHQATSPIADRDAYADPIDGVPFLPGEDAVPCRCGVAYRPESLDWLAVHCSGRCVHCDSPIEAGRPSMV